MENLKSLFLSGGGLTVFPFLGVIEVIGFRQFQGYYAVSAGSVLALIMCLASTPNGYAEPMSMVKDLRLQDIIHSSIHPSHLVQFHCVVNSHVLRKSILSTLRPYGMCAGLTFAMLKKTTTKSLYVICANLSTGQLCRFGPDESPDVSVMDALMASMALPFLISPVSISGSEYVDAGIINNTPLFLCPADTVALVTHGSVPMSMSGIFSTPLRRSAFLQWCALRQYTGRIPIIHVNEARAASFFRCDPQDHDTAIEWGRYSAALALCSRAIAGWFVVAVASFECARPDPKPVLCKDKEHGSRDRAGSDTTVGE